MTSPSQPDSPADRFMTVAEVAEVLKLNQQTVRNWIDRGLLPAVHVGRRVRIKRSDFDQLVEQGYTGSRAAGSEESFTAEDFWNGDVPPPLE